MIMGQYFLEGIEKTMAQEEKPTSVDEIAGVSHKDRLIAFHLYVQRAMVRFAAPFVVLLYCYHLWENPCWQHVTRLISLILAIGIWIAGLQFTKAGKVERAALMFAFSVIGVSAVSLALIYGSAISSMMANLVTAYYLSLFSVRYIYGAAGLIMASLAVNGLAYQQNWYEMVILSTTDALTNNILMGAVIISFYVMLLIKTQKWNKTLVSLLTKTNAYQSKIINAANKVATTLSDVIAEIVRIADLFADQSASLTDMATTTTSFTARGQQAVDETTAVVANTRKAVETTLKGSAHGKERLLKVQSGFEDVVKNNDNVKADFTDLISMTDNIAEVLRMNQEMSAQIKTLALNASIQAVKAGEHGVGFRVVAQELKDLIQDTEERLVVGQRLLHNIQQCALKSTGTLQKNMDFLVEQFGELQTTSAFIEEMAEEYVRTAEMMEGVATGANTQQELLNKVDIGMKRIGGMVADFEASSKQLLDCVERISGSHQSLKNVFADTN